MYLYQKYELEKKREEQLRKIAAGTVTNNQVINKKYVSLMSSMSHTYGNALAFIQKWVIDLFPEDTFKTIHVNSKIAHRQIRSTSHEFLKKSKPMIIFRPRIANREEDRFLQRTPMIERQTDIYSTWGNTNLQPFVEDVNKDIAIKYQLNRSVFYVDVLLIFSTLMQQIDYRHYLENAVRWEHPFSIETCFESYLSQELLKIVGDLCGVPLYDEKGNTKDFLTYMNGHSVYPITYKLRGSSGNKEFYRYYPVNIETTLLDLNTDDGEAANSVMNQYQITFTIKMEFNSTGFYYLFSDKIYDIKLPKFNGENTDIIPVFTDIILKEDLNLQQGWILHYRASLRLENDNDFVDMTDMMNDSIKLAIDYHLKHGLPLFDLIDIKVRKQGNLIRENKDYEIDYHKKILRFKNQDTYHTYTILICINLEYVNQLIKDIYKLE